MDRLTPEQRSRNMRMIRNRDTEPEFVVRRMAHHLGYRYRLHVRTLPGTPDLVFPSLKKVIFVHGCFWHQHESCKRVKTPQSRTNYWIPKLVRNRLRDAENQFELTKLGWETLVIWECETSDGDSLSVRLMNFLEAKCSTHPASPAAAP